MSPRTTWIAPRAWAFVTGAAVALAMALSGAGGTLLAAGLALGAVLMGYFVVGYAVDRARGRADDDDGPDAGWHTTGPYG